MLIINAKRWNNNIYGNTYHSVEVYQDKKLLGKVPFSYGYSDHYLQTAFQICIKASLYLADNNDEYIKFLNDSRKGLCFVADVTRKRDL